MSESSAIEWVRGADGAKGSTWNPIRAAELPNRWVCAQVSPGCQNCYASTFNKRLGGDAYPPVGSLIASGPRAPGSPEYGFLSANTFRLPSVQVKLDQRALEEPLRWRRPRRVFVCSMTDLFGDWVRSEWLDAMFEVMARTPQHTYLVLTKRVANMRRYLQQRGEVLPNVWAGVSIETAQYTWRANLLRETPAAVRWISAEPLLGPLVPHHYMTHELALPAVRARREVVDFERWPPLNLERIDWLVVGGESGGSPERALVERCPAKPPHLPCLCGGRKVVPKGSALHWLRDLRTACQEHDTKYFFKQFGGRTHGQGGRILDGRTWDEYPEVTHVAQALV